MGSKLGEKYKWVILVSSALSFFGLIGLGNNVFSVYIIPVTAEFGIMRTAFTICLSLMFLFIAVGAMVCWNIYDKVGMLRTERIASVLFVAGYITVAFTHTLFGLYFRYALMGFCLGLTTSVPLSYYLKRWFGARSGFAVGLAFMGSGFAGVLMNPLAERFISGAGWRTSFIVLGTIGAVLVLIPVFFLLKDNPYYRPVETAPAAASDREILSDSDRYHLPAVLICLFLFSICAGNYFYTVTPYLEDIGYSSRFAAVYTSVTMGVMAAGKITQGYLADKIGVRSVTIITFLLGIVGLACMPFLKIFAMLIPVTVSLFMVPAYNTVAVPLLPKAAVKPELREKAVGWFSSAGYAGYAASQIVSALVYDMTGSYVPIYVISGILMVPLTFIMIRSLKK